MTRPYTARLIDIRCPADAMLPLAFLDSFDPTLVVFIGVLAVLLFGGRLPEVARSFGQKLAEFRRSAQKMQEEFRAMALADSLSDSSSGSAASYHRTVRTSEIDQDLVTTPKFVPPPAEPPVPPEA